MQSDLVVPGYGQDVQKASQEGHLSVLVGIIVLVAWEDLAVYSPWYLYSVLFTHSSLWATL